MIEVIFEYRGFANTVVPLAGLGVILGFCGLTIYKVRRIGAPTKRHYLKEKSASDEYREGQLGFDFNKTNTISYFITKPQL